MRRPPAQSISHRTGRTIGPSSRSKRVRSRRATMNLDDVTTMTQTSSRDARPGLQAFLLLEMFVKLTIWSASFAVASVTLRYFNRWPTTPIWNADFRMAWDWGQAITLWMLVFNVTYVAALILLKVPIPNPKEGKFELRPGTRPGGQLIRAALISVITKARYEAPFPAIFVYQLTCLPPLRWFVGATIGPRSKSVNVTQPILGDPHLTTIGKNVVIGFGTSITGHTQDRDAVTVARTVIEDDVLIGAECVIYGGCTIKRGAIVGGGAIVRPFTTIGEYEVWAGVPAKKIKDLPPAP